MSSLLVTTFISCFGSRAIGIKFVESGQFKVLSVSKGKFQIPKSILGSTFIPTRMRDLRAYALVRTYLRQRLLDERAL